MKAWRTVFLRWITIAAVESQLYFDLGQSLVARIRLHFRVAAHRSYYGEKVEMYSGERS